MFQNLTEKINAAFKTIENDLNTADRNDADAMPALLDGIRTAQSTMAFVRTTVASLREDFP